MTTFELQTVKLERVDERPEDYNTACHRVSEHPALVAESQIDFDLDATTFDKWLPLILHSRGMGGKTVTINLNAGVVQDLREAVKLYKATGEVPRRAVKELSLEEPFATQLAETFDGRQWFCRSDDVSPKDGVGALNSITSVNELLTVLATSWRMHGAYCRHKCGNFRLHLLPWDNESDTISEFRVFVAPVEDIANARITAVSQYSWWRPLPESLREKLEEVVAAAHAILMDIKGSAVYAAPLRQGFSFDVQWRNSGVQLIELNGFGALQATGACLFNWVTDRHILYDEDDSKAVAVRICVE